MKKNYEKMLAEYRKLGDRNVDDFYTYNDFEDLVTFIEDDEDIQKRFGDHKYITSISPVALVAYAFRIGYAAAIRREKALQRKEKNS